MLRLQVRISCRRRLICGFITESLICVSILLYKNKHELNYFSCVGNYVKCNVNGKTRTRDFKHK